MKITPKIISKIIPGLSKLKNWTKIGEIEGYPIIQHIEKGTKAVFISEKDLKPLEQFEKAIKNKKIQEAKLRKEKSDRLKKVRKITNFIQTDAKSRNLGLLDFSPRNWFNYAKGYKTPKENIQYYEESFLPQIRDSYTNLVNDGKLYFDPKIKKVIGIIDGEPVPFNKVEDQMAYIVTNTPNAKHLWFNGTAFSSGVPRENVQSFIKHGGASAVNRPNWESSNPASLAYYRDRNGKGGISGFFTSIKPNLIRKYLPRIGKNVRIPEKPIILTPEGANPSTNNFKNGIPLAYVFTNEPFGYQITSRPIKDDIATKGTKSIYDINSTILISGTELPLKSILGNSGRYSMKDKNPFNTIINPLLITGGLTTGGLGYAARNKESN